MNPPSAIHSAMNRDRKPFTYTPGGLDLSEIKSERMAKRLMRNAMNQGVPELPSQPIQSPPTPSTPIAVPNFNCLPVQVFPAFNLPANPKSLLRTRSTPDQNREAPLRVPPQANIGNSFKPPGADQLHETFNNNTPTYSQVHNNNHDNNRPTSLYEYGTVPRNTHNSMRNNYGSDAYTAPILPEISYDAEYCHVSNPANNNRNKENIDLVTPVISEYNRESSIKDNLETDISDFAIRPLTEINFVHAPVTKPVEDKAGTDDDDDEQKEVKVVKKQVKKEKKVESQNGDQNGDTNAEAEMTVKLPTKKSAAKTETKVEVVKKVLPDGSVEEIKTTTTKTTIDGRTEIKTQTETTIIPKEEDDVEEVEEEEEEENGEVVVQDTEENGEEEVIEEPKIVVIKKTVQETPVAKESSKVVKKEERSETTTTKKVVVQKAAKVEQEAEEEEEEVEESEPVVVKKTVAKPPPPPLKKEETKEEEVEEEEEEEEIVEEKKDVEVEQNVEKIEVKKQEVEEEEEEEEEEIEEVEIKKPEVKTESKKEEQKAAEEEVEEEEYEEAKEPEQKPEPKVEKQPELVKEEVQKEEDEESEYTEEEVEPEKEEAPANEEKVTPKEEPVKEQSKQEEKKEEKQEQPPPEQKTPLREPSIPLDKVEDVEIKPIGLSKTHTESTEIKTNTSEKPSGTLSTQTEYNRIENIVTVNRTTKTLDHSYEQMTQQGIPTVKTYFAPERERVSTSPQPAKPYQPVYPPQPQPERRHSLLLERLSTERQIPSADIYQNNFQANNQNYEQLRQWSQEPQSEVINVSNVKPSMITNQQWYQQSRNENLIYNNVAPTTPTAQNQQWSQPQPQQQYQPSYTENTSNNYQQNSYPSYTPKPNNWAGSNQSNQYSYLNKDSSETYQQSTQQYSSSYVPPPWEQDPSYVAPELPTQNFYQPPPSSNTFSPSGTPGWQPAPPPGKFSKPTPTAYVPPAPNQSFVKTANIMEPPKLPGRKTYYSEYERRYITVPESTYIPSETKPVFQPQPDPSPQYFYDNNEPTEAVEHQWRKELREFTEKTSQTQQQTEHTSVKPPWEEDTQYAKVPTVTYTPTPSWSQTLRPQSYRERSFESEYVGSKEWTKTNTLGRGRPLSSYGNTNVETIPERPRGVSVDRYNPNNYQGPITSEHGPVHTHTLNPTPSPQAKGYHNPNVPAYHARASAEPREHPVPIPQARHWGESRATPLQSRSFKYLQWITGTED